MIGTVLIILALLAATGTLDRATERERKKARARTRKHLRKQRQKRQNVTHK